MAAVIATSPAGAAPPEAPAPARAPMRYTTRVLRAAVVYLNNSQLGFLQKLIDRGGFSYETGEGQICYDRIALVTGCSRRHAMRRIKQIAATGFLHKDRRFWTAARPNGDFNRANFYQARLPAPAPEELPPEAFADDEGYSDFDTMPHMGPSVALDAPEDAAAPPLAETRPSAVKVTAQAAVASCSTPGSMPPANATNTAERPVLACVRTALCGAPSLASIATDDTAERLAKVAEKHGKTVALVEAAISAAADMAAGRTGTTLEAFVASLIRREDGRSLQASQGAQKEPSLEEKARRKAEEKADRERRERQLQERGEAERERKLRAAKALSQAGP